MDAAPRAPASLDARRAQIDAARFAGRFAEIAALDDLLADGHPLSVALVHGPGGIGKSTLLREVARRARDRGYTVFAVDGRELAPDPDEIERALDGARDAERPLVVVDAYEHVAPLGAHLRAHVLPALPATARVIIAGRQAPERAWAEGGWDAITTRVPLRPLSASDARELLDRRGVDDTGLGEEIIAWAGGSPLALGLAADGIAVAGARMRFTATHDTSALSAELLQRLTGDELDGADPDVLAVAALAHSVDARMLDDVLPQLDGEQALAWLRGLSFSETVSRGVTLHETIRHALRDQLQADSPDRDRELRRRIADHLFSRTGEAGRVLHFGELIRDPVVRWAFGAHASRSHRVDTVRDGDVQRVELELGAEPPAWWPGARRWFAQAPHCVLIARDQDGLLAGFSITVRPSDAPSWAGEDPMVGPVIAHALALGDPDALIRRDNYDLAAGPAGDAHSAVLGLLNAAFALRADLSGAQRQYCISDARDQAAAAFNDYAGPRRLLDFDQVLDGRELRYDLLDYGAAGNLHNARALVYRDLGLPVPSVSAGLDEDHDLVEVVREALRAFHEPLVLTDSPLARGSTTAARAASVQALLLDATDREFGRSRGDQLLKASIQRGYTDADCSHDVARLELNVSRATYFRRLGDAVERLAVRIGGS